MGKLFDEFGGLTFRNEDEVSQNFILPLLQKYLGYSLKEIVPEKIYPATGLYSGVNFNESGSKGLIHKPDFVACMEGNIDRPQFIIDSKGPKENINNHFGQLRSYASSVGRNFLMMTNGTEVKVYDVNNLIFHSVDIADLQIKISQLITLLGRQNQASKSDIDLIKEFDFKQAVSTGGESAIDREIQRARVLLADFDKYLNLIKSNFEHWHLPTSKFQAINNLDLKKIDPNYLLSFLPHQTLRDRPLNDNVLKFPQIESEVKTRAKVFIGDTGSGKTSFLKYLTFRTAQYALELRELRIPIFIALREIGHGYNLETLIISFLNRHGYPCQTIYELPDQNDFVFFLDAYDEIPEAFRAETFMAIERLASSYSCFITSRPNVVPNFAASASFDIQQMTELQVEKIARQYIEHNYYEFNRQLINNGLLKEAGNTLLLLFLISIFKESGNLPPTVTGIINAIITRVKNWQDQKSPHPQTLKWETIVSFLSALAFNVYECQETGLNLNEAEPLLLEVLNNLEKKRKIKTGMTTGEVLASLAETGLFIVNGDHLYFWHRLFLDYFAAFALKEKFLSEPTVIERSKTEIKWHTAITGMAALLPSVTGLVKAIGSDIWLAAYCLIENSCCEETELTHITDQLKNLVRCPILDVRAKAFNYLSAIDHPLVQEFLFDVASKGEVYNEITLMAFPIIAKTKTNRARKIIYDNLNRTDGNFFLGWTAQCKIMRALFYFDEPDHLQIIENWKKHSDYWADQECKDIFLELSTQNKITPVIKSALEQFFLDEFAKSADDDSKKLTSLAGVLSVVTDEAFALKVLKFPLLNKNLSKLDDVYELLKGTRSLNVVKQIVQLIKAPSEKEYYQAERLMAILVGCPCEIPKELFIELVPHPDSNIGSAAIGALKRYPYYEVKDVVLEWLYGEPGQLQSWALGVLVGNAEIVPWVRRQKFPEALYRATIHTLLNGVRKYHLAEAMPLMDRVFHQLGENKRYESDEYLCFDLAGTYYFIGEKEKSAAIISWFFAGEKFLHNDRHLHMRLMDHLKYLDPELAVQIAGAYFKLYFPPSKNSNPYELEVFFRVAETLNGDTLKNYVKQIADYFIKKGKKADDARDGSERALKVMVTMANVSDESWVLGHLNQLDFKSHQRGIQFRNLVECLANIGGYDSLKKIKDMAKNTKTPHQDLLLNLCDFASFNISRRLKIPYQNGDILND
jgi:hypothetical protein